MSSSHVSGGELSTLQAALAPVAAALLARAREEAAEVLAEAERAAAAEVAAAQEQARTLVEQARAQGEQDGEQALVGERARSRRAARRLVLRAQREVYDELRQRCQDRVREICAGPAYPPLRRHLAQLVHQELGPEAALRDDPAGGVVGEVRGRRLDLSGPVLVDRAISARCADVEALWAP